MFLYSDDSYPLRIPRAETIPSYHSQHWHKLPKGETFSDGFASNCSTEYAQWINEEDFRAKWIGVLNDICNIFCFVNPHFLFKCWGEWTQGWTIDLNVDWKERLLLQKQIFSSCSRMYNVISYQRKQFFFLYSTVLRKSCKSASNSV